MAEIDKVMTLDDALRIAQEERFGEAEDETLSVWLICTAFEHRFDDKACRAFKAAALLVANAAKAGIAKP